MWFFASNRKVHARVQTTIAIRRIQRSSASSASTSWDIATRNVPASTFIYGVLRHDLKRANSNNNNNTKMVVANTIKYSPNAPNDKRKERRIFSHVFDHVQSLLHVFTKKKKNHWVKNACSETRVQQVDDLLTHIGSKDRAPREGGFGFNVRVLCCSIVGMYVRTQWCTRLQIALISIHLWRRRSA